MRVLAHLHVQPCPCSRCRVSRNYARLLAAQALRDEAATAHPITPERVVVYTQAERLHRHAMSHV